MLYRLEYINLLDANDVVKLLELLDYINSPNIFINRIVKDMIDTYDNDTLCDFIKNISFELPKKSRTMLFDEIKRDDCNDKYINTLSKYLPEFTSKIIEYKISQLNYVEISLSYRNYDINNIPKKYSKNIVRTNYITKFVSQQGEFSFLFIYFKDYDSSINYYNYHIKQFDNIKISINIKNE